MRRALNAAVRPRVLCDVGFAAPLNRGGADAEQMLLVFDADGEGCEVLVDRPVGKKAFAEGDA